MLAPLRILVVDDNVDAAVSLATILRFDGHEVEVAHNGLSALDAATRHRPVLLFLDIGMPGMSGFELAERLRGMPECAQAYIAAVTGYGAPEDLRKARAVGFNAHLTKPATVAGILACVKEAEAGSHARNLL
jgi:CheY-like chemotaxis protein